MIIGTNNGIFHRIANDRLNNQVMGQIYQLETTALEFVCLDENYLDKLLEFDLKKEYQYLSLHAPGGGYQDNDYSINIINKIQKLQQKFNFSNIVIHYCEVKDFKWLNQFKNLPISLENEDQTKPKGQSVAEMAKILDQYDFKLTLDLNHCYVNDQKMELANDFWDKFKDKIAEFHLSGYKNSTNNHWPLFKTKQDIIIDFLKDKKRPIIIESVFEEFAEAAKEIEYINK